MFEDAFKFMVENEGGYVNDPNDKGGETKWGISKRAYPDLDISKLTLQEAQMIYLKNYWNPLYAKLNKKLAIRLFDLGVNMGVKKAVKILQHTLNKYFDTNLTLDGVFGSTTLLESQRTNKESLYSLFVFEASLYYQSLNPIYLKGWLNRLYRNISL